VASGIACKRSVAVTVPPPFYRKQHMAIMHPLEREREDLRMRMNRASSRDEYEYFRDRLHDLERRDMMFYPPERAVMPLPSLPSMLSLAPDPETPLSFLSKADKKLLLIGEIA